MPIGTITALRAQEHDPQRINVFVNDEFAIGVSLNTLTQAGLFVGKPLDADGWAQLEQAERHDRALQAALRYLDARPRSSAELRERLLRKQFSLVAIDSALTRLAELGLVDDTAFARFWVENRQSCRPRGLHALRNELSRKGVARDVIDTTLTDSELIGDEGSRAWALARAALRKYADAPDRQSFQRRLGGYLQRRGFGFELLRPILDTLWSELHASTEDGEEATYEP